MALYKKAALGFGWILGIAALGVVIYSYVADMEHAPEGFGGIPWASNIRDLPEMKLLAEDGHFGFYTRENEAEKFEGVDIDKIVYGFYKGRFYNAVVYYRSPGSFSALKESFEKLNGSPYQPDPAQKKYFWSGNVTTLLLTYDDAANQGRVSYLFQEIENEIEANEKAAGAQTEKGP